MCWSDMLEERLGSQDEPLAGDEVVGLHMDLFGEALVCEDAHAWADLVVPAVHHGLLFASEVVELFECGQVEVCAELFGLNARHEVEFGAWESVFVLAFSRAEERLDDACIGEFAIALGHNFTSACPRDLEAAHVPPLHEP